MKYVMRSSLRLYLLGCILLCSVSSWGQSSGAGLPEAVPGEYIIKYKNRGLLSDVRNKLSGKASLKGVLEEGSLYHVSMKSENIADVQADSDVEYIEPNYYLIKSGDATSTPLQILSAGEMSALSSTTYTQSYSAVQMTQAWSASSAYSSQNRPIVAIIDSGLNANHPVFTGTQSVWVNSGEIAANGVDDDFNGFIDDINGWNFISNSSNYNDDEGHGTHVGGIVVGAGLDIFSSSLDQSKIRIMPLKFLDSTGSGTTANAIKAVYYAVNNGAKVINCSWGGSSYSASLHEALAYAYNHQVLVVTAAGNNNANNDSVAMYPANYDVPSLISVAATSDTDTLASFSNYGVSTVSVSAPGLYIYSTYLNSSFATMSGTSMAAPFVAGAAALAMREATALTGYQIKSLVNSSVDVKTNLSSKVHTSGRVNAYKLIQAAKTSSQNNVLASQPDYTPVYKSSRSIASDSGVSAAAAGCGLVKAINSGGGLGGGSSGAFPYSGMIGFIFAMSLPVLVWTVLRVRASRPENKRQYDRFKIDSNIKLKVGEKEMTASLKTISVGGVSFNAEEALSKGGLVSMKILSPDGREQIEVEGHVVWCENNQSYGVKFDEAKSQVHSIIEKWTRGLVKT